MFGKHFTSMYEGSMVGAGAIVFAVWGYVISHAMSSRVEINSKLLAMILGETEKDVQEAIAKLEAPDPNSRCRDSEGRKMVKEGQFQYFLPAWEHYRSIRDQEQRREYNRQWMAEKRAKTKGKYKPKTLGPEQRDGESNEDFDKRVEQYNRDKIEARAAKRGEPRTEDGGPRTEESFENAEPGEGALA